MSYTREQAEQVLRDWNTFHLGSSDLKGVDRQFLNHKFPQLPERGWVIRDNKSAIVFRTGKTSGYGLNHVEWKHSNGWLFFDRPEHWQPATKEEVQAMLEKEAERHGLVKGVKVNSLSKRPCILISPHSNQSFLDEGTFFFLDNFNRSIAVMKYGIWATPIDDLQERIDALVQEAKDKGKNLTIKID